LKVNELETLGELGTFLLFPFLQGFWDSPCIIFDIIIDKILKDCPKIPAKREKEGTSPILQRERNK